MIGLLILIVISCIVVIETSAELTTLSRSEVVNSKLLNNLILRLYSFLATAIISSALLLFAFVRPRDQKKWVAAGLDEPIPQILTKMRGAQSRVKILSSLQEPRHRGFLSDTTGIDWREVAREIVILRRYGLVELVEKKGRTEMYHLTGKGMLALKLIEGLGPEQ